MNSVVVRLASSIGTIGHWFRRYNRTMIRHPLLANQIHHSHITALLSDAHVKILSKNYSFWYKIRQQNPACMPRANPCDNILINLSNNFDDFPKNSLQRWGVQSTIRR